MPILMKKQPKSKKETFESIFSTNNIIMSWSLLCVYARGTQEKKRTQVLWKFGLVFFFIFHTTEWYSYVYAFSVPFECRILCADSLIKKKVPIDMWFWLSLSLDTGTLLKTQLNSLENNQFQWVFCLFVWEFATVPSSHRLYHHTNSIRQ